MAFFDQLQRISAGQYQPLETPIHRLDPRTKILAVLTLMITVTVTTSISGLAATLAFIFILLILSKTSLRDTFGKLSLPLPVILILAALQFLITPPGVDQSPLFSWWIISIYPSGISAAGMLCLRFIALVWLFSWSGLVISRLEMIYGFDLLFKPLSRIGIRTDGLTLILQMMLRFIPYLVFNAEKIAKSQASRGAKWDDPKGEVFQKTRQILPIILPLFTLGLRQSDALAAAMAARGFGSAGTRSGLRVYSFGWLDALFLLLSLSIGIAVLFLV